MFMADKQWDREARQLLDRALFLAKAQQDDEFARDLRKALGYVAPDDLKSDERLHTPEHATVLDEKQLEFLRGRLEPILDSVSQVQRFVLAHQIQDEARLLELLQETQDALKSLSIELQ
jgi:hypothetical protein